MNIKEGARNGQRETYVLELILEMKNQNFGFFENLLLRNCLQKFFVTKLQPILVNNDVTIVIILESFHGPPKAPENTDRG